MHINTIIKCVGTHRALCVILASRCARANSLFLPFVLFIAQNENKTKKNRRVRANIYSSHLIWVQIYTLREREKDDIKENITKYMSYKYVIFGER